MPRFERLTVEEARTLSRNELLPRIEEEQKFWYERMNSGQMRVGDDDAFKTFNRIMHIVINPDRAASADLVSGAPEEQDYWTKPLGELGHL
ncbi:hypothetical protein [Nonomuraea africana]|uniref:Uncharacterized protein n=1 Tax=Nonomuraea africana TaxID=46171 RepID=A0ABR9KRA8_9ACTN|nr:hypothetical protein [Nonomuraea africana]MBE1564563.1 hypothetical protein [Nonomuraea africana]